MLSQNNRNSQVLMLVLSLFIITCENGDNLTKAIVTSVSKETPDPRVL